MNLILVPGFWQTTATPPTDQRPERISRAIYVDSGSLPDDTSIDSSLPGNDVEIPPPPWDLFRESGGADLRDLSEILDDFLPAEP